MKDTRGRLVVYVDDSRREFNFNVSYVSDGGRLTEGWEEGGVFATTHDAIIFGQELLADYLKAGYQRIYNPPWRRAA